MSPPFFFVTTPSHHDDAQCVKAGRGGQRGSD